MPFREVLNQFDWRWHVQEDMPSRIVLLTRKCLHHPFEPYRSTNLQWLCILRDMGFPCEFGRWYGLKFARKDIGNGLDERVEETVSWELEGSRTSHSSTTGLALLQDEDVGGVFFHMWI